MKVHFPENEMAKKINTFEVKLKGPDFFEGSTAK